MAESSASALPKPDRNLMSLSGLLVRALLEGWTLSTEEDRNIAEAKKCAMKAADALDLSVRRYFAKLARDYRHRAELSDQNPLVPQSRRSANSLPRSFGGT